MFTTASTPDFSTLFVVALALVLINFLALGFLYALSLKTFERDSISRKHAIMVMLKHGVLSPKLYFVLLSANFLASATTVYQTSTYQFVDNSSGLAAYVSRGNLEFDYFLELNRYCFWNDRFDPNQIDQILNQDSFDMRPLLRDVPLTNPTSGSDFSSDPEAEALIEQFYSFAQRVSEDSAERGPDEIHRALEGQYFIFVFLCGLFLFTLRAATSMRTDSGGYPIRALVAIVLLSIGAIFLGYYAVLKYHSSIEVSSAYVAGRVVCIQHVKAFMIAQAQSIVSSGIFVVLAFLATPRTTLKELRNG